MVYVIPVPSDTPPVRVEYQLIIPALAVAPSVTTPVPHRDPGVVVNIDGGAPDTVAITDVREAEVQFPSDAST